MMGFCNEAFLHPACDKVKKVPTQPIIAFLVVPVLIHLRCEPPTPTIDTSTPDSMNASATFCAWS